MMEPVEFKAPKRADELPPNIDFPEGEEFPAGLQERFQIVGVNPFSIEEAALVGVEVYVTTTSGTYHGEAEIHTALPPGGTRTKTLTLHNTGGSDLSWAAAPNAPRL